MKGRLDLSVVVPECDCIEKRRGRNGKIHRRACPRLRALRRKWGVA